VVTSEGWAQVRATPISCTPLSVGPDPATQPAQTLKALPEIGLAAPELPPKRSAEASTGLEPLHLPAP
jgi:hypothetical protein